MEKSDESEKIKRFQDSFRKKMVQSPISISLRSSKVVDKVKPLKYVGYWEKDGQAIIENTGTSAKVTFHNRKHLPFICGGPLQLNDRYIFEQMHFHWAEKDNAGSEHVVNGQA